MSRSRFEMVELTRLVSTDRDYQGRQEWIINSQSRPFVCHVTKLNLRVVNVSTSQLRRSAQPLTLTSLQVFHYGFRPKTDWISAHPHFYPPAIMEGTSKFLPEMRVVAQPFAAQNGSTRSSSRSSPTLARSTTSRPYPTSYPSLPASGASCAYLWRSR